MDRQLRRCSTATKAHLSRLAGLIHCNTDWWGLAFEYDQGHNYTASNTFSTVIPAGKFGQHQNDRIAQQRQGG